MSLKSSIAPLGELSETLPSICGSKINDFSGFPTKKEKRKKNSYVEDYECCPYYEGFSVKRL